MKRHQLLLGFGTLLLCSWINPWTNDLQKAKWLLGTWEMKNGKGSIYESWTQKSENEFVGKSYRLRDRDTLIMETIRLVVEKEGIFYIPVVKNQNDGQPVRFKASEISATLLKFENPAHDFPQMITYEKLENQKLVAEISGNINGQPRKQRFAMTRVD